MSTAVNQAVKLAYRTLEYVSHAGEPPEPIMDCDYEMWTLAHEVLDAADKPIPMKQSSNKKWMAAINAAKAEAA